MYRLSPTDEIEQMETTEESAEIIADEQQPVNDESVAEQDVSLDNAIPEIDNLTNESQTEQGQPESGQAASEVSADSDITADEAGPSSEATSLEVGDSSAERSAEVPEVDATVPQSQDEERREQEEAQLQGEPIAGVSSTRNPPDNAVDQDTSVGDSRDVGQSDGNGNEANLDSLDTSNIALIDEELAEHERWAGATSRVGVTESTERAGFIAEAAGGGLLTGAAYGAAMGVGFGLVGRAAARFVPLPGVGAIIGGVASAFSIADSWSQAGNALGQFGQGSSEYELLANNIAAISSVIDVVSNILNMVAGVAGIVAAASWILTVATAGLASPITAAATAIALGIGIATAIMDGINAGILQPCVALFRAMHTFKSQADPRQVETQGAGIMQAAAASGAALGAFAGGRAADVGGSARPHADVDADAPNPRPEAAPPPAAAVGDGPAVHFEPSPVTVDVSPAMVDVPGGVAGIDAPVGEVDVPSGATGIDAPVATVDIPSSTPTQVTGDAGDGLTGMRVETIGTPDGSLPDISDADIDNLVGNIETDARADTYVELPAGPDVVPLDANLQPIRNPSTGEPVVAPASGVQNIETRTSDNPKQISFHEDITVTGVEGVRIAEHGDVQSLGPRDRTSEMQSVIPSQSELPSVIASDPVPLHGTTGQPRDLQVRTHSANPNAPEGSYSQNNPTLQVNTHEGKQRYLTPDGRWIRMNDPNITDADRAAVHFPVGGRDTGSGGGPGGSTPSPAGPTSSGLAPTGGGPVDSSSAEAIDVPSGAVSGDAPAAQLDAPSTDIQMPGAVGTGHAQEGDFSSLNWEQELEGTPFADQLDYTLPDIPEAPTGTNYDSAHKTGAAQYRQQNTMPEGTQAQHWSKKRDAEASGLPTDLMNENMSALQSRKDLPAETLLTDPDGGGTTYSIDGIPRKPGTVQDRDPAYQTEHKFADNYLIPSIRSRMPPDVDPRNATLWAGTEARWQMTGEPGPGNWGPQPPQLGQSSTSPSSTPTSSRQIDFSSGAPPISSNNSTGGPVPLPTNAPHPMFSPAYQAAQAAANERVDEGSSGNIGAEQGSQPGVEQVNPNYPPPPGTPQQLEAIQEEIVNLLAARARAESAEQQMSRQEQGAQSNMAPIQQTIQQTNQQISASQAHRQAVASRQQLNQAQQQRQEDAGSRIGSYAERAAGLTALTIPLHVFERFSHYASIVPGGVGDSMRKMNTDALRLENSFVRLAMEMARQQSSQAGVQSGLQSDQSRLEQTDQQTDASQENLQLTSEGAAGLQGANQQKLAETGGARAEAAQQKQEFAEAADAKQEQAQTLHEQLQAWSEAHKSAREEAIAEAVERIEAGGGVVTEVKET